MEKHLPKDIEALLSELFTFLGESLIDEQIENTSKKIDEIKHELGDSPDIDISNIQNNLSEFQKRGVRGSI